MRFNTRLAGLALLAGLLVTSCGTKTDGVASPVAGAVSNSSTSKTLPSTQSVPSSSSASTASSATSSSASSSSATASSATASSATAPTTAVPPTSGPTGTDESKYGEAFTWSNGLQVIVAAPTPFTPGQYASADPAPAYVSFAVTIVNNTGSVFDPILFLVSAQSGSVEASEVFDVENGYMGAGSTGLLNGRNSTFNVAFGVTDPADVILEVEPGFDYASAYFTNAGGAAPGTGSVSSDATTPPAPDLAKFGEVWEWTNGLEVSVSAPTPFTPGDLAVADPAPAYLSFTITITNRTGATYDPTLFSINAQSGDKKAVEVFDPGSGYGGAHTIGLPDGQNFSYTIGFGVTVAEDVVLEVTPGFEYDEAYFTS